MKTLNKSKETVLLDSDFLKVININGATGNLALQTLVHVNHKTSTTKLTYRVQSWNTTNQAHKDIAKKFTKYSDAFMYYAELYEKYGK